MKVTFKPSNLHGNVRGIASKSYLHRLILCASLAKGETVIENVILSDDIKATISAASALGKKVFPEGNSFRITDSDVSDEINVGECGSTFRFILPIASAVKRSSPLTVFGADSLASRPISPLYEELVSHGSIISEKGKFPMTVGGELSGGVYRLPGNVSSQFVSGLLLALPLCKENSEILIDGKLESEPYVNITLECLSLFGIKVEKIDNGYSINGGQSYKTPGRVRCECDLSNAAFFLAAGALSSSSVSVSGICASTSQGDTECISILEKFGAICKKSNDTIEFRCAPLSAVNINASDIPDLVPILALVASVSEGKTVVSGAGRLRFKESNRLHSTSSVLSALGADITETDDGLIINGVPELSGGEVSAFNDHRIAMTAAVASVVSAGEVTVDGFEAINKSYPNFLDDFASIGGKFKISD